MNLEVVIRLVSLIVAIISFLNYAVLLNEEVEVILNRKIKEFLIALVALVLILTAKVVFGCTLLTGIIGSSALVREALTLALLLFFLAYNVGLFLALRAKPVLRRELYDLTISLIVLYLFFDKVELGQYVELVAYAFLLSLIYVTPRVETYLKVLRVLVEPVNVVTPTKLFVVSSLLTALAGLINDLNIAKSFFTLAMILALSSFLSFDIKIREILKLTKC